MTVLMVVMTLILAGCGLVGAPMGNPRPPAPPPALVTTRAFLVGTQSAESGYGLYSYLLFAAPPPSASIRARYASTLSAFLNQAQPSAHVEQYVDRYHLNITYLPVTEEPPTAVASGRAPDAVEWILDHYNYARALAILREVPSRHHDGPYFVSNSLPLDGNTTISGPILYQDLSHVQPKMASAWVREFIEQARKPDWDKRDTVRSFVLDLRNAVSIAGAALPQIKAAMQEWIKVIET